jgi:hypothetical protein
METVDDPSRGNLLDDVWIVEAFRAFFNSLGIKTFLEKQRHDWGHLSKFAQIYCTRKLYVKLFWHDHDTDFQCF